jgi:hypothetical protein
VSKALIVPHPIEGFQCRNTRFQNPLRHFGLDIAIHFEALNILADEAMEWLIFIRLYSVLLAKHSHVLHGEGVQTIYPRFRLIFLDCFSYRLSQIGKVLLCCVRGDRLNFRHWCAQQQPLHSTPTTIKKLFLFRHYTRFRDI